MKLNRTWAMVVAIVMALTLSLGSTLAYLSDTDSDVNVMVLGNVNIVQNEQERVKDADGKFTTELQAFTNNQTIYPAVYGVTGQDDPDRQQITVGGYTHTGGLRAFPNYVDKIVTVTNTGKSDAYVRTLIAIPSSNTQTEADLSEEWLHYNPITDTDTSPNNGWYAGKTLADGEWNDDLAKRNYLYGITINGKNYEVYTATNVNVLTPGKTTGPCLAGFYLDNSVNYTDAGYVDVNGDVVWTEDTLDILVISQAVQAAGFADAYTALNAGYGEVNKANVAKWFGALYNEDGSINEDMIGTPGDEFPNNNPPTNYYTVSDNEGLTAALAAGETNIYLEAGDYTLPTSLEGVSLTANGDAVVAVSAEDEAGATGIILGDNVTLSGIVFDVDTSTDGHGDAAFVAVKGENVTIENCDFDLTGTNTQGIGIGGSTNNVLIKDCNFENGYKQIGPLSGIPGDVTIDGCTFGGTNSSYGMHLNVTSGNLTVKNCDIALFNTFFGHGNDEGNLTFENCTFSKIDNGKYNVLKLYRDADFVDCTFENSFLFSDYEETWPMVTWTFDNCTSDGQKMAVRFAKDSFTNDVTFIEGNTTMMWDATTDTWTTK